MRLDNNRDYRWISVEERKRYDEILKQERIGNSNLKRNLYNDYPEAVKHYLSLFPNNHICLADIKKRMDIHSINEEFLSLVHDQSTNERDILRFINHEKEAFFIVGSIFNAGCFRFGHHEAYVFPEFKLGKDYRPDYLLIGKGSGGYEFIFVEFEKSNGRVTLQSGYSGQVMRAGNFQILDWKHWIDSGFLKLKEFFEKEKNPQLSLPNEFIEFDRTRMHYVVVAGTRSDYSEKTYLQRRSEEMDSGTRFLHYDNLYDASEELFNRQTF